MSLYSSRRRINVVATTLCWTGTIFGLAWLVLILGALIYEGARGLSPAVFTEMTPPPAQLAACSTPSPARW